MTGPLRRVHMVGIGGAGMSALARLYLQQGIRVTGSDVSASTALDDLTALGAETYTGHQPARVEAADLVVYSSAVPDADPELGAARRLGVRALKHAQALGELFNTHRGIAVAGSHGKTTTTSMIAFILERCGFRPSFQVGGEMVDLGTSARWGEGEWMVVEADEFDRRFLEYRPDVAVVTNVEPDHFEYYGTYEAMLGAFADFLALVEPDGLIVASGHDPALAGLLRRDGLPRVSRFGIVDAGASEPAWHYTATEVSLVAGGSHFTVCAPPAPLVPLAAGAGGQPEQARVHLQVPGRHMVLNALAAIAACHQIGAPLAGAAQALGDFHGARRRFELLAEAGGVRLYLDYAHHPTEVRVNLEAARLLLPSGGRLWAVFQPHLLVRTEMLFAEFTRAFDAADVVVLTDVYSPAGREPAGRYRGSAELVAAMGHPNARHVPGMADARRLLAGELRAGDVVLVMGAGTIDRLGLDAARDLTDRATAGAG